METNSINEQDKTGRGIGRVRSRKKDRIVLGLLTIFFILVLMMSSFLAGVFMSGKSGLAKKIVSEEYLYIGKVTGLFGKVETDQISPDVDFGLFWKVWNDTKETYVDKEKLNDKKMFYGAIKGMVAAIGDPYTVFMDPQIASEFNKDLAGTFEGIGAEIGLKNEIITIIAPLPGMPAEKAGLKAGDKIIAINNETTSGMSVDEAVSKIRGPKGTAVVLSIFRDSFDKVQDFSITRNTIIVKSVRTNLRADGIFFVQITNFNDDTETLFNQAVDEILAKIPQGIILDLRNNPGGYLDTAIEVASEWVEDGIIVTEKYSEEQKNEHLARGRARIKGYKTVVLVNQGSASASEIVAGALQDYKDATIIGMKTFGKGSVQTLLNFEDGSSVKITIAKWLTPNGRSINDEGIMPDYEVDLAQGDFDKNLDPQMDAAVSFLKGESIDKYLVKVKATSTPEMKNN